MEGRERGLCGAGERPWRGAPITIRMWIGNPSTNQITEIPLPAQFSNNPDYKRMLVGMSNFIASTWAINGSASAGWYGDANATGSTSWTAYIGYVSIT